MTWPSHQNDIAHHDFADLDLGHVVASYHRKCLFPLDPVLEIITVSLTVLS